jgi:hypothetical protein
MERLPPVANVVISNVPGPQVPLFLAGAQMKTFFPVSIIVHGIALNITVQTYCGRIDFGIVAGEEAVPDLPDFAAALRGGFDELVALAEAKEALLREAADSPAPSAVKPARARRVAPASRPTTTARKASSKRSSTDR